MWPCGRVAGCPRCGLCGFPSADFGWWLADWEQTSQAVPGSALAKVAFPSQLAADNCSSVEPTVWRRHALTRSRQHWAVLLLELGRSVLKTVGIGNRFFFFSLEGMGSYRLHHFFLHLDLFVPIVTLVKLRADGGELMAVCSSLFVSSRGNTVHRAFPVGILGVIGGTTAFVHSSQLQATSSSYSSSSS